MLRGGQVAGHGHFYRKRPGGEAPSSWTQAVPGRFGSSRKKEAAPNLAGQVLIGYSIGIVIRHEVMLLQAESLHNCFVDRTAVALTNNITRSVRRLRLSSDGVLVHYCFKFAAWGEVEEPPKVV